MDVDERNIKSLIRDVGTGRLHRRAFIQLMVGAGLTVPMARRLLPPAAVAHAQGHPPADPPARGGHLKMLWWQGPAHLNPHFAVGARDQDGARIFYEPLAAFDRDGELVPILAAEIPTVQNGGVALDSRSVVWRLKKGVSWHDGKPFTAEDVVFNWEYAADPASGATTRTNYSDIDHVDIVDSHTIKVVFKQPKPFWAEPFCGPAGQILPKHVFRNLRGPAARETALAVRPVGTGPYRFVEFKAGTLVRGEINLHYHVASRPVFDTIEMKGGDDAASAARAVIETGEADFAWDAHLDDEVLRRMEQAGRGRVEIARSGNVERILCNQTDPWTEVDGERSSLKTRHPFLTDPAVRRALNLLVDRSAVQQRIYGRLGRTTANGLNAPARFHSRNTRWEFDVEKANQILDDAGWRRGPDGIRAKHGTKLRMVFQTTVNASRQKTQALVKESCARAGIDVELKTLPAATFFSSDPASPDTSKKFIADIQMYTCSMAAPDPQSFMRKFLGTEVAARANRWQGLNVTRWQSAEYDRTFEASETELDPVRRAALFIRMNDLVFEADITVPLIWRMVASAASTRLRNVNVSGWDSNLWNLAHWYREA